MDRPTKDSSQPSRRGEEKVCGFSACRAVVERRLDDVRVAVLTEARARQFGDLLKFMATARRPYRVVGDDEVQLFSGSTHPEGVCLSVKRRGTRPLDEVLTASGPSCLLGLPVVRNPHNLGAILRSAAHFGARAVLVGAKGSGLSSAAYRTAEGGAEWIDRVRVERWRPTLEACRAGGWTVVATAGRGGESLFEAPLPDRVVFLLGAEREGLPKALIDDADRVLRIAGTGRVESLNMATAAALCLAEWARRHGP